MCIHLQGQLSVHAYGSAIFTIPLVQRGHDLRPCISVNMTSRRSCLPQASFWGGVAKVYSDTTYSVLLTFYNLINSIAFSNSSSRPALMPAMVGNTSMSGTMPTL